MSNGHDDFLQKLHAAFLIEAREHVQVIASGLLALETPDAGVVPSQTLEAIFRHTHSLKGAARATGEQGIEAICQTLEEVFARCKRRRLIPEASAFDVLHRALDQVTALLDGAAAAEPNQLLRQLRLINETLGGGTSSAAVESAAPEPSPGQVDTPAAPAASGDTLRVAAASLDRMLLAAEDLLAVKQASTQHADELQRLQAHFDDWGKRWASIQAPMRRLRALSREPALLAQAGGPCDHGGSDRGGSDRGDSDRSWALASEPLLDFLDWSQASTRALEGKLRAVAKAVELGRQAAGKQIDELLEHSKGLLMLPFATLSAGLPKPARDLARDQGKSISLQIDGNDVAVDKRVLERMRDPLLHLLRNAIDHGVETPAVRASAGKPAQAVVRISAQRVDDNKFELQIEDDGAGIDPARVSQAAVSRGLLSADAAAALDSCQAVDLIFRSDLSTSPIISEISGRGLGLAIVREQVEALGGRVSIDSQPGHGARFRIVLPQSLATFRGVLVRVGDQSFVLPGNQVERVARLPLGDIKCVENRQTICIDAQAVALVRLADVLELPSAADASAFISVAVLGSGSERVAFVIDEVLNEQEVLVRSLRRPLVRVRNIAGATVLGSGQILAILNITDLIKSARRYGANSASGPPAGTSPRRASLACRVLLAEDSITTRMLLKGVLEGAGCVVKTAADGIEALTALRSDQFDLLVSDIEMPRLNGFDLTTRIRADPRLASLPVVLVTALSSREDRERGIDVGANAYLTKSGFDQRDLIDAVRRLAGSRSAP